MKVEQVKSFTPVVITLESQEEVDALHAVFNHGRITSALEPAFDSLAFEKLEKFRGRANSDKYWQRLSSLMK